jgi:hypothetical protein
MQCGAPYFKRILDGFSSNQEAKVQSQGSATDFMVDKVVLGKFFFEYKGVSLQIIIMPEIHLVQDPGLVQ